MQAVKQDGPLARAISQQSAEWLESTYPAVYDAIKQELAAGRTMGDIRATLRRIFGNDLREAFVVRIIQTAEWMRTDITIG